MSAIMDHQSPDASLRGKAHLCSSMAQTPSHGTSIPGNSKTLKQGEHPQDILHTQVAAFCVVE